MEDEIGLKLLTAECLMVWEKFISDNIRALYKKDLCVCTFDYKQSCVRNIVVVLEGKKGPSLLVIERKQNIN